MDEVETSDVSTTIRTGFFPLAVGERVEVKQAAAFAIVSKGDMVLKQGGAQLLRVGGDLEIRNGGAQTILAKGDVSIREGGALICAARSVSVKNGMVGLAVGRSVDISGARVLVRPVHAVTFGAVAGVVMALVARLLSRSSHN